MGAGSPPRAKPQPHKSYLHHRRDSYEQSTMVVFPSEAPEGDSGDYCVNPPVGALQGIEITQASFQNGVNGCSFGPTAQRRLGRSISAGENDAPLSTRTTPQCLLLYDCVN